MKNKLLLVNPFNYAKYPPLSLIYLASFIEQHDFTVDILEASALSLSEEETIERIINSDADCCGFTCMTPQADYVASMIKKIKSIKPDITILVGGVHVSIVPEDFLKKCPEVDYIVIGEGELTLLELLNAIKNCDETNNISGIGFIDNNKIKINPRRNLIENLDELPMPAWDKLPIYKYEVVTPERVAKPMPGQGLTLSYERGCPFQCTFCASGSVFGKSYRTRSPKKIIEEIQYLIKSFSIYNFFFVDEVLTYKSELILELCHLILEKDINIKWSCNSRCNSRGLNDDIILVMKQTGCIRLDFGVESGSPRILKSIKKGITLKDIYTAHKIVHDAGLFTTTMMMVGQPNETLEDYKKSLKMILYLEPEIASFGTATPFPGTELYNVALKNSLLRADNINWKEFYIGNRKQILKSFYFGFDELIKLADYANSVCDIITKLSYYKRHRNNNILSTITLYVKLLFDIRSPLFFQQRLLWVRFFLIKRYHEKLIDKMLNNIKEITLKNDCIYQRLDKYLIESSIIKDSNPKILIFTNSIDSFYTKNLINELLQSYNSNLLIHVFCDSIEKTFEKEENQFSVLDNLNYLTAYDLVFYLETQKTWFSLCKKITHIMIYKFTIKAKRQFIVSPGLKLWEVKPITIYRTMKILISEFGSMLMLPLILLRLLFLSYKTKELSILTKYIPADANDK